MRSMKKFGVMLTAAVFVFGFAACGSSSMQKDYASSTSAAYNTVEAPAMESAYYDYGYADEEYYDYEESNDESSTAGRSENAEQVKNDSARKLIKTHNIDVETEDFDGFVAMIQQKVTQVGGYIQNLNTYNGSYYSTYKNARYSNLTLRIPVDKTDEFLDMVGETANITNRSLSVEDITLSYVDLESKKKTYKAEEEKLLTFLEQAETIEEMLTIEDRLTNIRYQLESMESQLRTYDNLVDYTTVYLNISEVETYTEPEPESYGQQVSRSFKNGIDRVVRGFKNFVIDFVGALPVLVVYIIVLAILFAIVFGIVKGVNKHKAKKQAKLAAKAYAQMQAAQAAQAASNVNTQENNSNGQ